MRKKNMKNSYLNLDRKTLRKREEWKREMKSRKTREKQNNENLLLKSD